MMIKRITRIKDEKSTKRKEKRYESGSVIFC